MADHDETKTQNDIHTMYRLVRSELGGAKFPHAELVQSRGEIKHDLRFTRHSITEAGNNLDVQELRADGSVMQRQIWAKSL